MRFDHLLFPANAESDITKSWYQVGLYILTWSETEPFPIIPSERLADSWDKTEDSFELHSKAREEKPSEENKVTFSVSIGTARALKLQFCFWQRTTVWKMWCLGCRVRHTHNYTFKDKHYPILAAEAHLHLFTMLKIVWVPCFINVKLVLQHIVNKQDVINVVK